MKRNLNSIVFAPASQDGGVKSLYSVCEYLNDFGRSMIAPLHDPKLASWFEHGCELYDYSYAPDIAIYPEIYQPRLEGRIFHICFALGKHASIQPHSDLTVCKSVEIVNWVKQQHPTMPTSLILPSINRSLFDYDGRPKKEIICYMTRPSKHPETAQLLRDAYGDRVVEIVGLSEAKVAEALKNAKVFVWRGNDREGSPRPPKEALVAGCVVVGLESDLNENYHTNFGIRCSNIDELIRMAGAALKMPMPTETGRSVVRDTQDEKQDWLALIDQLGIHLRGRKDENMFALTADLAERHKAVELLTSEPGKKDQTIQSLSAEIVAKEQALNTAIAELASKEGELERMKAAPKRSATQLAERNGEILALVDLVAERQRAVDSLAAELGESQKSVSVLTAEAVTKGAQLERITRTLSWRLLRLYGKLKYPYLLPFYRLLGLVPRENARQWNVKRSSKTETS